VRCSTHWRLERLEARQPEHERPWHRLIIQQGEDPEPLMAAMVASGEAQDGDNFILRIIIPAPEWPPDDPDDDP
jgi:hypothetical protein